MDQKSINYTDFKGLGELRFQAQQHQDNAVSAVAQQFEAIYNQMLFSSMRQANESFTSESLGSESTKMYQDLYDKQMSLNFSQHGQPGGLADQIIKQINQHDALTKNMPLALQGYENVGTADASNSTSATLPQPFDNLLKGVTAIAKDKYQEYSKITSKEAFVKAVWKDAVAAADKLGVDPKFLVAQAALESGWGQKPIKHSNGENSFNVFGIKADSNDKTGSNAVISTTEYRHGIAQLEQAAFRTYNSYAESFNDYANFLQKNPRYQQALQNTGDTVTFAKELQKAGYATDPHYADKIIAMMESPALKNMSGK